MVQSMQLLPQKKRQITAFGGYCHNAGARPGQWYETQNLSDRFYPLLAPRASRVSYCRFSGIFGAESLLEKSGTLLGASGGAIYAAGEESPIVSFPAAGSYRLIQMGNKVLCLNENPLYSGILSPDEGENAGFRFVRFLDDRQAFSAFGSGGVFFENVFYSLLTNGNAGYTGMLYAEGGTVKKSTAFAAQGSDSTEAELLNIAFRYCVKEDDGSFTVLNLTDISTAQQVSAFTKSRYYIGEDGHLHYYEQQSGADITVTTPKIALFIRTGLREDGSKSPVPPPCEAGDMVQVEIGASRNLTHPYAWKKEENGYAYHAHGGLRQALQVLRYEIYTASSSALWHGNYGWDCYYIFEYNAAFLEWIERNNLVHDSEAYNRAMPAGAAPVLENLRFEAQAADAALPYLPLADDVRLPACGTRRYYPHFLAVRHLLPDSMAAVTEHNNRIWCADNGNNELRASALGNCKNWEEYRGFSSDSYAVSVGTDGDFNAGCVLGDTLYFFKEHSVTALYGTRPSNFTTATIKDIVGIAAQDAASLQVIGERAYYVGYDGRVYCFNGSRASVISDAFGEERYTARGAAHSAEKYYLLAENEKGRRIFVYNTRSGMWFAEDAQGVDALCSIGAKPCALSALKGTLAGGSNQSFTEVLLLEDARRGAPRNTAAPWSCESPLLGFEEEDYSFVSALKLSFESEVGASLEVLIRYENEAAFTSLGKFISRKKGLQSIKLPLRRCAFFTLKLRGEGLTKLYRLSYTTQQGSEK